MMIGTFFYLKQCFLVGVILEIKLITFYQQSGNFFHTFANIQQLIQLRINNSRSQCFILFQEIMCYLRNLAPEQHFDFDDILAKGEDSSAPASEVESNVLIPCTEKQICPQWSSEQKMLVNLFEMIEKNNMVLSALGKVLTQNSQQVGKNSIQTEQAKVASPALDESLLGSADEEPAGFLKDSSIEAKLFSNRRYKYSLKLVSQLSPIFYKERNFHLKVELIDENGKQVRNCNLINLCLGVCTNDGQWIHENKSGQPFMKGKTEVELYNGEGSFAKIYARDVSRNYQDGRINIVIYSKPTTLMYSHAGTYERLVNSGEIRPLILEGISIKAKKKD